MEKQYDLIVVGAGHAGCEAAHIAATMGCKVLLVTMNMETIAKMSCNPAMGGVAKGQIIREIDALGGMSAHITDRSMIQFRMLNRSKGAAMWSPRSQNDRWLFARYWRIALEQNPNVHFFQDMVKGIHTENGKITGVKTAVEIKVGDTITDALNPTKNRIHNPHLIKHLFKIGHTIIDFLIFYSRRIYTNTIFVKKIKFSYW